MTVFEKFKLMNIDEYVEWFEANCLHNYDPCIKWFDKAYCQNCEAVDKEGKEYAYCELNHKCRYFKEMDSMPDDKQTIKMWLESQADDCIQCNANEKVLDALRKQVPMKPNKLTYKLLLDDGWIYECPTCGCACGENKYYPDVTKDDMYCTQCGQMLDWS